MKTIIRGSLFAFIILLTTPLLPETDLKVYEPMKGEKYRRIISFKPIMEISDASGDFIFQHPRDIKTDDHGNIYIKDNGKILKFDPKGNHIASFLKTGEGPGEVMGNFNYHISGNTLHVYCRKLSKYIQFDLEGKLVKECRFDGLQYARVLGIRESRIFMDHRQSSTQETIQNGFAILTRRILSVGLDGQEIEELWHYPMRIARGDKGGLLTWDPNQLHVVNSRYLIVNHTREYQLTIFDLETRKAVARISRKFDRIPLSDRAGKQMKDFATRHHIKMYKYFIDIINLLSYNDRIWVFLMHEENEKQEVDVYNLKGEYVDHFYIPWEDQVLDIHNGYIFLRTETGDTVTIKKCLPVGL